MNAQKKLDEAQATIRNLTIERDALKTKSEVQRKALAHEAMETVRLRALFDTIKKLVKDTAGSEADILSKVVAELETARLAELLK